LSQYVEIQLVEDGLRIQLLEDSAGVFFETGSATPSRPGHELLGLIGTELSALPNEVAIEGHTDARPYPGTGYTNWELSADRANSARRIMVQDGLRPEQVAQVRGFADRVLRVPADPYAAGNRRVAITVLFDSGPFPPPVPSLLTPPVAGGGR
jgi:chemotaxis protein MotB